MTMFGCITRKVTKNGEMRSITLPKTIAELMDIDWDDEVVLSIDTENQRVILEKQKNEDKK